MNAEGIILEQAEKMLLLLPQHTQHITKHVLFETLGILPDCCRECIIIIPSFILHMHAAEQALHEKFSSKKICSQEYAKFIKTVTAFRDHLEQALALAERKEVVNLLSHFANSDDEVPPSLYYQAYDSTLKGMARIATDLRIFLLTPTKAGRPSLENLHTYVLSAISLYEKLSHEKFTILRHKDQHGAFSPITNGHAFVYEAVQIINRLLLLKGCPESYSDKNIYNSCEKAQKAKPREI